MPKFAQIVMGPAGCGKSTYCSNLLKHLEIVRRTGHVVNLDPAAEVFNYDPIADIRELIEVDDVMEDAELKFGPNGGLVFCMEYFCQNFEWLQNQLEDYENDYIIFDCPGQIELYTHIPVMRKLVDVLQSWDFRVCGVFLIDSQFMVDCAKFFSGTLAALSAMVNLEIPHVNVMSKMDFIQGPDKELVEKFLDPNPHVLIEDTGHLPPKFQKLNKAIATLIDDFSVVRFLPLDISDEESIGELLFTIDSAIQFDEEQEVRIPRDQEDEDEGWEDGDD